MRRFSLWDDTRAFGPFINDNSVYFANFNRSKQGVTLNLKEPEAKEIFKEMVKHADVVIENYRPGTMEKQMTMYWAASAAFT